MDANKRISTYGRSPSVDVNKRKTITTVEASERYGVSAFTLRKWALLGKIPGTLIEGRYLLPLKEMDKFFGVSA